MPSYGVPRGARCGTRNSIGKVSPSVRVQTPDGVTQAVEAPAVATATMIDLLKIIGEMKTMKMS